ncbi:MAG: hypothetical protein ACM36C_02865 [Acidobacteriota bacterium]
MTTAPAATAGDPIPPDCGVIEVRLGELRQLFNAIDPSPFREKDLDPNAEQFIVGWAREFPREKRLALVVYLDRPAGVPEEPGLLREAIAEFFSNRALMTRRRLHQLFRRGRTSLIIGISVLAAALLIGNLAEKLGEGVGGVFREGLLVGGWVAMWRPMQIFLYDWWPIRADAQLADRLSQMSVRIVYMNERGSDAWRRDWPVARPSPAPAPRE